MMGHYTIRAAHEHHHTMLVSWVAIGTPGAGFEPASQP